MRERVSRNGRQANLVGVVCVAMALWAGVPDSPVADAAMRGDTDAVRALLREGADVNAAHGDGMTALHWAARRGGVVRAEILLYAGANVAAVTRLGDYTPLHLASKAGHAGVIVTLLEAGSDANAATSTGAVQPIHFAAVSGSVDAIAALLDHGADVNATESQWRQTPLMFAAASNRAPAVKVLLERGADPMVTARVIDIAAREALDRADQRRRSQLMAALRAASEGTARAERGQGERGAGRRYRPGERIGSDQSAAHGDDQRALRSGHVPARAGRRSPDGQ